MGRVKNRLAAWADRHLVPEWRATKHLASTWANITTNLIAAASVSFTEIGAFLVTLVPFLPEEGPWRIIFIFVATLLTFFGTEWLARMWKQEDKPDESQSTEIV